MTFPNEVIKGATMKRSLLCIAVLLAISLTGCAGWYVPRWNGPHIPQQDWLSACPSGKRCVEARWCEYCDIDKPYPYSGMWVCPKGYWYASWIGMSDNYRNPSPIPMLCVERGKQ